MTPSRASVSVALGLLAASTAGSLLLKDASESAPQAALAAHAARAIATTLRNHGFAVQVVPHRYQSMVFLGVRGPCRVAARDAQNAGGYADAFRVQMADVGPPRYLYRGARSIRPPEVSAMIDRLVPRLLDRLGFRLARDVPVALSTSAGCSADDFGLDRIRVSP